MRRDGALVFLACLLFLPRAAEGQRREAARWKPCALPRLLVGSHSVSLADDHDRRLSERDLATDTLPTPCGGPTDRRPLEDAAQEATVRRNAWSVLASAVLPGAGQALLGQWRAVPYVALEGYAWSSYASDSRRGRRSRDAYRTLAATVARAPFSPVRPNGDFGYYERMEDFLASGVFSRNEGGLLEPETDTTTFNGAMWLLARRTFWTDPASPPPRGSLEWQRAESFYLQRAIRPAFRWSWEGFEEDQVLFRQLIRASNDGYRDALGALGIVLGNHVLSAVDAYVTIRVRRSEGAGERTYAVRVSVPMPRRR